MDTSDAVGKLFHLAEADVLIGKCEHPAGIPSELFHENRFQDDPIHTEPNTILKILGVMRRFLPTNILSLRLHANLVVKSLMPDKLNGAR